MDFIKIQLPEECINKIIECELIDIGGKKYIELNHIVELNKKKRHEN